MMARGGFGFGFGSVVKRRGLATLTWNEMEWDGMGWGLGG